MEENVFTAALAGLLHDIGKLAQRAATDGTNSRDDPTAKEFGREHARYTARAITELVPARWQPAIQAAAGHHHRPQTHLERVVALANLLSVGEPSDQEGGQPDRLLSIFCDIGGLGEKGQSPPQDKYLPLKPLAIREDTIFPSEDQDGVHPAYQSLWAGFKKEAQTLKLAHEAETSDPEVYLASMLKLMQRYTWCVPSAYYQGAADVSLYDHSRTTAGLAACLANQDERKVAALCKNAWTHEPVALLVGGDISGVQKFIYTITSRGATSALRGRSMYLQLLTEVTARYVLRAAGLPLTNLIYAGGGHFYLLAPLDSEPGLAEAQRQISRVLLRHHQGDLYLALAEEPLHGDEFRGGVFSRKWRDLTQKLQGVKQRQFSELDEEDLLWLFRPHEHGGNEDKLCAVCQREHPQTGVKPGEEHRKCPPCLGFEELGKDLRQARFLCVDEIEPAPLATPGAPAGDWQAILAQFGYRASLHQNRPAANPGVLRRHLLAINDEALAELEPGPAQVIGRQLMVNVTPILTPQEYDKFKKDGDKIEDLPAPNSVKSFEVMAEQSAGIKRLGILRMDVDSLGQIFSRGLGEKSTLARVAALSFAMSLFFEGWAGQIGETMNREAEEDLVYSIYSGGDDLFFVGSWHLMPELAERISRDLARYSGGHAGVHLSGGVALAGSKYPLYQAAEDAHDAEQAAKTERQAGGTTKNALNFLGKTIPWGRFDEVKGQQEDLVGLVTGKNGAAPVPRSLIQRLSQLYAEYEQANRERAAQGEDRVYWGPWHWHTAYSLGRLARQHGQAEAEILAIRAKLGLENFTNIEWIGLAARWAELLIRKGE